MACPKCGSENVEVSREASTITGATSGQGKFKLNGKVRGISVMSNNVKYKTIALCKDCGWSWSVKDEQEEKDAQTLKGCGQGCLFLILVAFIIIGIVIILS